MPVGNSDQGIGLFSGQMMFTIDNISNYIDWWHEPTSGESFDHQGNLLSIISIPTLSIGLNDYWMASITQLIGYRGMGWDMPDTSWHHRTENSTKDFVNAIGGLLGDTHFNLRYLALNAGSMEGYRFFIGYGITIPSKNTLTSDPFFLQEKEENNTIDWEDNNHSHRHFSLSEGTYKNNFEIQLFKKQPFNPIFYGFTLKSILPIKENDYGFKPSEINELTFIMLINANNFINTPIGFNLSFMHSSTSYWNGIPSPNSRSFTLLPGISFIKNTNNGTLIFGMQKPFFIMGSFSGNDNNSDLEQKVNALQLSLGYRRILNISIPFFN